MKAFYPLIVILLLQSSIAFGQMASDSTKRKPYLAVIEGDTLGGPFQNHLPFEGEFEQLILFRNPNGSYTYLNEISGAVQSKRPVGKWTYARIDQEYFYIDIEKEVYFYADSSIIESDFGRIKYNTDSTEIEASIWGLRSKVEINCKEGQCLFQSIEAAQNRFCFKLLHFESVVEQLREGVPEIEIFRAFGWKDCP